MVAPGVDVEATDNDVYTPSDLVPYRDESKNFTVTNQCRDEWYSESPCRHAIMRIGNRITIGICEAIDP